MLLSAAIVCALAIAMDYVLGEPKRWHPLIGFANFAQFLEKKLRLCADDRTNNFTEFAQGIACWICAVLLPVTLLALVLNSIESAMADEAWLVVDVLISTVILYLAIGQKSLSEHAMAVYEPLSEGRLNDARYALSMIVSRDTAALDESQITTATVETVLENTNDAVIGPILWFLVAGIPGVLLFRLSNTLDAMWGYRTQKYEFFGKTAARMDDLLGWLPARLTVLLFAAKHFQAVRGAWVFGRKWYSPNAGPVMAAGAGALNLQLGGKAQYNGEWKERPILFDGQSVTYSDIKRSAGLMYFSSLVLMAALFVFWLASTIL